MQWQSQRDFVYGELLPFGEEYFGTIILYQKFSINKKIPSRSIIYFFK
jgi:hypothetical protein